MKTIYIKDITSGQVFENETFAIYSSTRLEDKNGKPYYNMTIGDKTGRVSAKIWSDALKSINVKILKEGRVVSISGKVDEYRGAKQINILSLNQIDETSLDDFIESSMFDADEMMDELLKQIDETKDTKIKSVLKAMVTDDSIKNKLKYWPAAKVVHHEFRSGLLQHILEMLAVADGLQKFYPEVNFDILNAGIILHDLGKVYELDASQISTPYSTDGTLLGHIYMGGRMFEKFAEGKLTKRTFTHILHLILSHHGTLAYGSPVLPATPEAFLLTHIDKVSSKARTADSVVKSIGEDEEFSNRVMWLDNTRIWNTRANSLEEDVNQSIDEEEESEGDGKKQMSLI